MYGFYNVDLKCYYISIRWWYIYRTWTTRELYWSPFNKPQLKWSILLKEPLKAPLTENFFEISFKCRDIRLQWTIGNKFSLGPNSQGYGMNECKLDQISKSLGKYTETVGFKILGC